MDKMRRMRTMAKEDEIMNQPEKPFFFREIDLTYNAVPVNFGGARALNL